jgi:hypothetical protein
VYTSIICFVPSFSQVVAPPGAQAGPSGMGRTAGMGNSHSKSKGCWAFRISTFTGAAS